MYILPIINHARICLIIRGTCSTPLLLPSSLLSLNQDGELVAETLEPVYVIPEARPSHRGRYACIAKNSNGITNSSSPGLLTIMGKKEEGFKKGCSKSLPHPPSLTKKKGGNEEGTVKADKERLTDVYILTIVSILVYIREHEPVSCV